VLSLHINPPVRLRAFREPNRLAARAFLIALSTSEDPKNGMGLLDLFWLFIAVAVMQPVITQRLLSAMRQRKIAEIEKMRGSRVILLVHRQETMNLLGFPIMRYIDINHSEQVMRAIELTDPDTLLDLVLHTPGGLVLASLQIARAMKRHRGKTTVFVPHFAMSGGTLIALAADEIVMSPHAVLGPVDPQINGLPAASIIRAAEAKPIAEVDDNKLVLADIGRKATAQVSLAVSELLQEHLDKERADQIADKLSRGEWTHDYAISPAQAQALGRWAAPSATARASSGGRGAGPAT
jgi:ClpP class serine protease